MGIYTNTNSAFPSQVVSDAEKASWEYGTGKLASYRSMNGLTKGDLVMVIDT